jgi:hypothetical protein
MEDEQQKANNVLDFTPPFKKSKIEGKIFSFLAAGMGLTDTSKRVDLSPAAIWKRARKYVREGYLEQISKYPATFRKTVRFYPPLKPVGDFTTDHTQTATLPIVIPKKFGASFAQVGRPKLPYDERGKAIHETAAYKVIFGRYKTQIWLKSGFVGQNLVEMRRNGIRQLNAIAAQMVRQYGLTSLAYLRLYDDIEVVTVSEDLSAKLAALENLEWGEQKPVAEAMHKAGDSSDPDNHQINALPGHDPHKPFAQGRLEEHFFSGQYLRDINALTEAVKAQSQLSIEDRKLLSEVVSGFVALRQTIEMKK